MRLLLLLLTACSPTQADVSKGESDDSGTVSTTSGVPVSTSTGLATGVPPTGSAPDFRQRGPHSVDVADSVVPVSSCDMEVTTYQPAGATPTELVVLAHGFQRRRGHVADLADHWASWGLAVVTPNLCHATAFDSDHIANGTDLIALADALGQDAPVIYSGHSAGGLASFLASAVDPSAVAYFGLDPVDTDSLGADAAGMHGFDAFGMLAEPSLCNSGGNSASWFGTPTTRALRIGGSDHCDFEGPTDLLCTAICAGGAAADADVREVLFGFSTAFVMWQSGQDPRGVEWWTPGMTWYDLAANVLTEV